MALDQLDAVHPCRTQKWFGYTDPSLYSRSFNYVSIYVDRGKSGDRERALAEARYLVGIMSRARLFRCFNQYLRFYLQSRRLTAECIELGLRAADLKKGASIDEKELCRRDFDRIVSDDIKDRVDPNFLYNLACTCALLYESLPDRDYDKKSLGYLKRSLKLTGRMERNAEKVKRLANKALIDGAFEIFKDNELFKQIINDAVAAGSDRGVAESPKDDSAWGYCI